MKRDLGDLIHGITNLYVYRAEISFRRAQGIDKAIWDKWNEMVPDSEFGKRYVKNRAKVMKAAKALRDWWDEETWQLEDMLDEAVRRIMEGAKQDLADERTADAQEEDENADEVDVDDIEESDLDDENLWQWWSQEWHHNVDGKHWLTKHTKGDIDLQGVRQGGLEGEAINIVEKIRNDGNDAIDYIDMAIETVDKAVDKYRVMRWVFSEDEDAEPIEW